MKIGRLLPLFLALLVVFSSCSFALGKTELGYDIPTSVTNLDPQFATDPVAQMIILNLFEGLVVQSPDGQIYPGAASSWAVSPDQLTYIFTLRSGLTWRKIGETPQEPLTGADFRFGLYRLFSGNSPFGQQLTTIKNARQVLAGQLPVESLGITADSHSLTIQLEEPDEFLLEKLASSWAIPCQESFFLGVKGRYGLGSSLLRTNGPFRLSLWNPDDRLTLVASPNYLGEQKVTVDQVDLFVNRENPHQRFADGITDLVSLTIAEAQDWQQQEGKVASFSDTTWCLTFRQKSNLWGVPLLRQGMAYATNRQQDPPPIQGGFTPPVLFFPPTVQLFPPTALVGGEPLYNSRERFLPPNSTKAAATFQKGLDALGIDRIPNVVLFLPEGLPATLILQQGWKEALGVQVSAAVLDPAEIRDKLTSGEWDLMIIPLESATPLGFLEQFTTGHPGNIPGYHNSIYDQLVAEAGEQTTLSGLVNKAHQAESLLLSDGVVIPLYTQSSYYGLSKRAQGVEIFPSGRVRFHPTTPLEEAPPLA